MKIFKALRKSLTILFGLLILCSAITARAEGVNVTVGEALKYPSGFNYMTHYFYIDDHLAYCLQPKLGPTNNGSYEATEIYSEGANGYPLLIKILACGYGGPNDITPQYFPGASEKERYIYTHIAAGYAYMSNSEMSNINDITGMTEEQFEASGIGNFVRAAWNTEYTGSVKVVRINGYQDIGYLASYSLPTKHITIEINKYSVGEIGLKGAEYGIYSDEACQNMLARLPMTNEQGKASIEFESKDQTVYLKEINAPAGYVRDEKAYPVSLKENKSVILYDKELIGKVILQKYSSEGQGFKGDSSLKGAEYGIYALETVNNVTTGQKYYEKDEKIGEIITNESGLGEYSGLKQGKYYLKELKAPEGYNINDEQITFEIKGNNTTNEIVEVRVSTSDDIKKASIQINKTKLGNEEIKVEGAEFSLYLKSNLPEEEGVYQYEKSEPVVIGDNGEKILVTDENGVIKSCKLPYGTYIIHENKAPKNYIVAEDKEVTIGDNDETKIVDISDDYYKIKFRINKFDATNSHIITQEEGSNCQFSIYDTVNEKYVEENITLDANGRAYSSVYLEAGSYRIEEVSAPLGYLKGSDFINIDIDDESETVWDESVGEDVISIDYYDLPLEGKVKITKTGEKLVNVLKGNENELTNAVFQYEKLPLEGAKYGIYAKEDVFYPDGRKDSNGNREKLYDKDQLIAENLTDANGNVTFGNDEKLYYGEYYIKELSSPEGYLCDEKPIEFVIRDEENLCFELNLTNVRQRFEVSVNKLSEADLSFLSGAYFKIYAAEDIKNHVGDIIVKKDDYIGYSNSDQDGISKFNLDLTKGKYYVKETIAPRGYYINEDSHNLDLVYEENVEIIVKNVDILNKKIPDTPLQTVSEKVTKVLGASVTKRSKNNYKTEDNGVSGYSILLDRETTQFNKKYIAAGILVSILIVIFVSSFIKDRKGKNDKKKK